MPPERKIKLASSTAPSLSEPAAPAPAASEPAAAATPEAPPPAAVPAVEAPAAEPPSAPPSGGLGLKLRQKASHPLPATAAAPPKVASPPASAPAEPAVAEPPPGNLAAPAKPEATAHNMTSTLPVPSASAVPPQVAVQEPAIPATPVAPGPTAGGSVKADAVQVRQQAQAMASKKGSELSFKKQQQLVNLPPSAENDPGKLLKKKVKIDTHMVVAGLFSAVLLLAAVGMLVIPPAQKMAAAAGGAFPTAYVGGVFALAILVAILVIIPMKAMRTIGSVIIFIMAAATAALIVGQPLSVTLQMESYQPYLPAAGTAASAFAIILGALSLAVDTHKNNYILAVIMGVVAGVLTQLPVADFIPKDFGAPSGATPAPQPGGETTTTAESIKPPTGAPAQTPKTGATPGAGPTTPDISPAAPAVVTVNTQDFSALVPETWTQMTVNDLPALSLKEGGLMITVSKERNDGSKLAQYVAARESVIKGEFTNAMAIQKPIAGKSDRKEVWVFAGEDMVRAMVVEKGPRRFCLVCRGKREVLNKHSEEIDQIYQSFQPN